MARKKKKQINKIIMNREEQIDEASVEWYYNEAINPDIDDAFKAGAKYADEHPSEETIQKVIEAVKDWLNEQSCCGWIEDVEVDKFIDKFDKEIQEKLKSI